MLLQAKLTKHVGLHAGTWLNCGSHSFARKQKFATPHMKISSDARREKTSSRVRDQIKLNPAYSITVADPEGLQGVRSNPLPAPRFIISHVNEIIWSQ